MTKLSDAQIRKIIKAHNIEETVKIPTGLKKDELEKFVESKGFKINHDEKSISKGGKKITLEQAEKVTAPKQKTALQKQKAVEKKEEKAVAQKKKERELKKEAVKKATKDLVPKTSMPKKVDSKPVPKKEVKKEVKKKEEDKTVIRGGKVVKYSKKDEKVRQEIIAIEKKRKEAEAKKPKRKQLGKTQKPGESAVVQPGKPKKIVTDTGKKIFSIKKPKKAEAKAEPKKKVEAIKVIKGKKKSINLEPTDKEEKPAWLIKAEKERAERDQKQKNDMLKQYKDRWNKNFKNQYQWSDAQVKRIEEILFDENGIKSTGAENTPEGFKLFFSVDGKSESSATFKFPKFTEKKKDQSMMKEKN